ncbi:hypothetical protein MTR62_05085 [Novosphingobium sp. 1949]|uniref:DUF4440 domain-containing protein n=1 Tax=Novosphingobium organovorum TaxID=2930092 RepID=A0ABT0BAN9_9SPHN|nr:hypothetical protein [Novosphingobium organovorum]MCJ2182078.1 hypothetical protein [Novosphingobium organovorum]
MIRTRGLVTLALIAGALAPVGGLDARERRPAGPAGAGTANPSALVATELAFNRRVREKGQWAAFRDFADETAVLFVPQPVLAQGWLGGRKDPPGQLQWQPSEVWISCDGTMGLTSGGWTRSDGTHGRYTTIWKQRPKKGDYRWVVDLGAPSAEPVAIPEFVRAKVTDCPAPQPWAVPGGKKPDSEEEIRVTAEGPPSQGRSVDGTLRWRYATQPSGETKLVVTVLSDGEDRQLTYTGAAAGAVGANGAGGNP